jgi:hypothetical protein
LEKKTKKNEKRRSNKGEEGEEGRRKGKNTIPPQSSLGKATGGGKGPH